MTEQFYTIAQVAKLLAVSRWTVKRWIDDETLEAIDINPRHDGRAALRVRQSTLDELLERLATNRPRRAKRRTGTALKPISPPASKSEAKGSPRSKRRPCKAKRQYV